MSRRVVFPQFRKYPRIDLYRAIQLGKKVKSEYGYRSIENDKIFVAMGYGGRNGASWASFESLQEFGLLVSTTRGMSKLTGLARQVFDGESEEDRVASVRSAAFASELFREIYRKFNYPIQDSELAISFLNTLGFTEDIARRVVREYEASMTYVESLGDFADIQTEATQFDSPPISDLESQQDRESTFEFKDWMRLPIDDDLTIRIMSDNKRKLGIPQLEYIISVLESRLDYLKFQADAERQAHS